MAAKIPWGKKRKTSTRWTFNHIPVATAGFCLVLQVLTNQSKVSSFSFSTALSKRFETLQGCATPSFGTTQTCFWHMTNVNIKFSLEFQCPAACVLLGGWTASHLRLPSNIPLLCINIRLLHWNRFHVQLECLGCWIFDRLWVRLVPELASR